MATYFYVVADEARNIITGVTRNLKGAIALHKSGTDDQTSATRLVYARAFDSLHSALEFESRFLRLSPRKRDKLIGAVNPNWEDWSDDLFPAVAGMAYAESVDESVQRWLEDENDDPGGTAARLPCAPFDPILTLTSNAARGWPKEGEVNWLAIN